MADNSYDPAHAGGVATLVRLDSTLGSTLVGALLSMTLWGVTCTQTYDYFMDNKDSLIQRSIVALLWAIDTLGSAMNSHIVYHYLVTNYANPFGLLVPTWSINCQSLVAFVGVYFGLKGFSNFIIRTMFARRIYQFGRNNFRIMSTIWIMGISICDFVVAIIVTATTLLTDTASGLQHISRLMYLSFALGVTADLSVAIALCWLLQSSKTGFRRSDSLVNGLMAYVVNTGLLVTLNATVGMITYIVMPDNLVFFVFYMMMGKLYVNAYLASLNARVRLREKYTNTSPTSECSRLEIFRSKGITNMHTSNEKSAGLDNHQAVAITLETTIERRVDGGVEDELECLPHAV